MEYIRKKKSNKSFIITILILILTIIVSSQKNVVSDKGSNLANSILKPIEKFTYSVSSEVMEQIERSVGSKETRSEVERLEAENRSLVMENARPLVINTSEFLASLSTSNI